jgi:dihydroxyacetone kinase-like protein
VTAADLIRFLTVAARVIGDAAADLDRLDVALGDGDHGENMLSGFESVVRALDEDTPTDTGEILRRVGHTLVSSVGGASGPLYGTAFIEAGIALHGRDVLDLPALARGFEAAAAGLARRGRCVVGDKTIYDALQPAAVALAAAAEGDATTGEALVAATRAARRGMLDTIPLVARRGLALRLGERSRGHQDPGATSCFLMIRATLTVAREQRRVAAGQSR